MGLFAAPEPAPDFTRFVCTEPGPEVEVFVERGLLVPTYLRKGTLRVAIEGHGRFSVGLHGLAGSPTEPGT